MNKYVQKNFGTERAPEEQTTASGGAEIRQPDGRDVGGPAVEAETAIPNELLAVGYAARRLVALGRPDRP